MRNRKIPVIILVLISAGIAVYLTRDSFTPYVTFEKAMANESSVQIIGRLDKTYETVYENGYMTFRILNDTEKSIAIKYKGIKPANFEEADQIVAIGTYSKSENIFNAEKILTKCPSKYEKNQQ